MKLSEVLKKIEFFSHLDDHELLELENISSLSKYVKDQSVFTQGDNNTHLLILVDGSVNVYKSDDKGNQIIIGTFKPYSFIAEAATLNKIPFPSSCIFTSAGYILKIDLIKFEKMFLLKYRVSYEIIKSLLSKIDLLQQNIHFNLASNSKDKILYFYSKNEDLQTKLKQYEIASILNITPETLSRNTNKLIKEKKLIRIGSLYKVNKN
ncbi:MAG: Transcriptional regulator, Crp/Fnr family protein [uncultured Campylobacterales bacterium]|uniref:Transcriptional regulator, Crp/Fnr family protein n=1 Tax=uncultured Campylobacterales bacterium TaxID=352960 RepID=A0A6S6T8F1_9BACT|nr:MAG: Transcriptional regulator, Crp/Fnr family protein [uncultured Campylobacterales bacterium]